MPPHALAQRHLATSVAMLAFAMLVLTTPARAAELPVLTSGHTDVGVNFADGAWDLHVHAEELSLEFEPDAVWLQAGSAAMTRVPTNAAFSFLGQAGAPIWRLPDVEDHSLLFLGLGTEEMASGIFSNDTVTLTLKSVSGPGDFALYTLDMFGDPVVAMNSRDGIDPSDARTLTAGSHAHVNWAFSTPGRYRIGLQASGVLAATGEISTSEVVEYLFDVQPARLRSGHVDAGVNFEAGAWDLHVHAEDVELEFAPNHVTLEVAGHAAQTIPGDPRFAFLGAAGTLVWVLPQSENPALLFLGLGTEELGSGIFSNDSVALTLKSVTGPGHFALYHLDPLSNPVVSMNSRDGIDPSDARTLTAGSHAHVNWAFSTPGRYRIGLQASGVLAATGEISTSEVVEYLFEVHPAPLLSVRRKDAATLTLQWPSEEHRQYHLQSTTGPASNTWADHPGADAMEGTGEILAMDVPVEDGPHFFRLEIRDEDGSHHHEEPARLTANPNLATRSHQFARPPRSSDTHFDAPR